MKRIILSFLLLSGSSVFAQSPAQIENQVAFARLYGYLKYFYPGDEAAKIDWDKFAIYGAEKVESSRSSAELKDSLQSMIYPMMPGVVIIEKSQKVVFDRKSLTPASLSGYETIAWQHFGVGLQKDSRSFYASARTNRLREFKTASAQFGSLVTGFPATESAGRNFLLTGKAKMIHGTGKGHFWLRVDKKDKSMGFFNNMDDQPISTQEWTVFTIKGKIDTEAATIALGAFLIGDGAFAFDDLTIKVEDGASFKEVYRNDFNSETLNKAPESLKIGTGTGSTSVSSYSFNVLEEQSNRYVTINSPSDNTVRKEHKQLFKSHPQVGEYVEKELGRGLKVMIPIALYGSKTHTFPLADSTEAAQVINKVNSLPAGSLNAGQLYTRIGNIINAWNVFQHFYPYFDVVKTDWQADLKQALAETYNDKNTADFGKTLQKLTAKLQDGHIRVSFPNPASYLPPFAWKWVEDQLVITSVLDKSLDLEIGNVITHIDGQDARTYFNNVEQHISAATEGWLNYRAETESLTGVKDSKIALRIKGPNSQPADLSVDRTLLGQKYQALLPKQDTIKALSPDVTYISISNASMKAINAALPVLEKSKAIICDLRGYPTDNTGLIEYLLTDKDTSSRWMQIPQIIYPDQENISGYQFERWPLKPGKTHLNAKVYFLIDGQAISYAESYMSFIEHYKLATIIGQPTAGTNGNVNRVNLPGNFSISFTGMKVVKHDGSQLHGIGIQPNIYVKQTLKGIRESRDEILERAILEASKN